MKLLIFFLLVLPLFSFGQGDLLDELEAGVEENGYVKAAFKGVKIVNFESTKLLYKKDFHFVVSHRFGSVKYGIDNFFGLDEAVTRLQFLYGITDGITVGVSRSSYLKNYGATIKYRLLHQKENGFPFTAVGYHLVAVNTAMRKDDLPEMEFKHRLSYTSQLLISRKLTDRLSLELMPTFLHENYVVVNEQDNSQFALGVGGRYKLTKRWSINADYGWHLNRAGSSPFRNPLSIGVDLETGGHIFQMHFTNAQPMFENGFLGQAAGDWGDGDIYFGFNLTRVF